MDDGGDDLAPTRRFSTRVEHYAKYRPGYPRALIDLLARETGMNAEWALADIGSGTGILTELLLKNGNVVFAVEPNAEMRNTAEKILAPYPRFKSLNGTGEQTTLPDRSVRGVVVAQAFHWFDGTKAATEFDRVLQPGGFIALVWNARDTGATAFMRDYERVVHTHGTSFARSGKELVAVERLRELFGGGLHEMKLRNFQELDWDGLRGRLLSASYMPLEGQSGSGQMLEELRSAFDRGQKDGRVRMDYETRVYLVTR
jgi:SAM-dependent methyltransferase